MNLNIFSMVIRVVKRQIANVQKQFMRYTKILSRPYTAINKFVKSSIASITSPPQKRQDYFKIGEQYISKRISFIIIVGGIVGTVTICNYIYPLAEGLLWTPTITLNSTKFHTYTGKAKVVDNVGTLIYKGEMKNGSINGVGVQYDKQGNLHYSGEFSAGEYSGDGELYREGQLVYKGHFSTSEFDGMGEVYDKKGSVTYKGEFRNGVPNGNGAEFKNGVKLYQGSFLNGYREGKGVCYEKDGIAILYEGEFSIGKYSGIGKLYRNEKLIYSGGFREGVYEGDGIIYDEKTGAVLYKGQMADGLANGIGELYDIKNGKLLYSGTFIGGAREGSGEKFDQLGFSSFLGEFKDDQINFKAYLHATWDEICESFGTPTASDKSTLLYKQHKAAFAMENGECQRIVLLPNGDVFGITPSMTRKDVQKHLGVPDFSLEYPVKYKNAFKALDIAAEEKTTYLGDKYLMDNYFIKVLYQGDGERVIAIEIGG